MGGTVAKLSLPALSKLFESRPKAAAKNPSETGDSDSSEKMKQIGQIASTPRLSFLFSRYLVSR